MIIVFTELVKKLNKAGIFPIVYGSLGLYLKLEKDGEVNDIDFIINSPEEFLICKKVLLENKFEIDPEHERELIRNGLYVSFLNKIDIEKLVGEPLKLKAESYDNAKYFNIEISQYLKIYKNGLNNKFRREKKERDDLNKIEEIEHFLTEKIR